jgi:lipoprotein signal peptidase
LVNPRSRIAHDLRELRFRLVAGWWSRARRVAVLALPLAAADWAIKAWWNAASPEQITFHVKAIPLWLILTTAAAACAGIGLAWARLMLLGCGVLFGGTLGNAGEAILRGGVTDFIPLGVPYAASVWSPGDVLIVGGGALMWLAALDMVRRPNRVARRQSAT